MQPSDRREAKIAGWLRARARAVELGDRNLVRSLDADLHRIGYRPSQAPLETTVAAAMPETAVVPKPRGRPRKAVV